MGYLGPNDQAVVHLGTMLRMTAGTPQVWKEFIIGTAVEFNGRRG